VKFAEVAPPPVKTPSSPGSAREDQFLLREPEAGAIVPAATLGIWVGCLVIGGLGFVLRYPQAPPLPKELPPVLVQSVKVDLSDDPAPSDATSTENALPAKPDVSDPQPPALPNPETLTPAPALVSLAELTPAPAFVAPAPANKPPMPAQPAAQAQSPEPARPAVPGEAGGPARQRAGVPGAFRHLTFGVGEGRQPSPEYPREAGMARQQGTVVVRFTVGEDGSVLGAQVQTPCRWPLLNQAAVRAVRDRWHFQPGGVRSFDVSIQFELPD
jgi:protein TonB